jgi:tRNA(Ile)-lysidine synthase TilS/MesJ
MTTYDRCTKCIQSASFPRIKFDENGVCNFCRKEFGEVTDNDIIISAAAKVESLLETTKRVSEYDAVMCYSGGKDSTYVLQLAVEKYNLKVLAFTLDNGFLSDGAFTNINKVVDHLGIDLLTFRPSKAHFAAIIRASMLKEIYNPRTLTRISAGCNSCISMVNTMALKIAIEKKIPFILAGFTLGQIPANAIIYKNNYQFLKESRESSLKKLKEEAGDFIDDYYEINENILQSIQEYPTTMNLLCLENITEDEIVENIKQIGWTSPGDVDGCSSNCRLNTFNNYVHKITFGYNPYELELSHLIRKGLMTRSEALEKIEDQPEDQRKLIQAELRITDDEILEISKKNVRL